MNRFLWSVLILSLVLSPASFAQQPNTPGVASLVFAGFDGPTYPNVVTFSSTVVSMDLAGAAGSGFILIQAGTFGAPSGLLASGIPTSLGLVDIDFFTTGFTTVLNGIAPSNFFEGLARMDPTGNSSWTLPVPAGGNLGAFQALVQAPSSPGGLALTAASSVNVNVAQNLLLTGGDDATVNLALAFGTVNFYQNTYNDLWLTTNGNVTFTAGDNDFTPTAAEFINGAPRIAPLWTDLAPGATVGGAPLVGTFFEDASGWTVRWVVQDYYPAPGAAATAGVAGNTFGVTYDYAGTNPMNVFSVPDTILLDYVTPATGFGPPIPAAVATNWALIGITPGGGLTPAPTAFSPAVEPQGAGGAGLSATGALASYLADFGTPGTLPNPTTTGVIGFSPLGLADFYSLF